MEPTDGRHRRATRSNRAPRYRRRHPADPDRVVRSRDCLRAPGRFELGGTPSARTRLIAHLERKAVMRDTLRTLISSTDEGRERLLTTMQDIFAAARAQVYSEPVQVGDRTIITASEVISGGGFGFGSGMGAAPEADSATESDGAGGGAGG